MTTDIMQALYTKDFIDRFVIVSGDSDYSSLINKLREYGKYTVGIGLRRSTSEILVKSVDEFAFYEALVGSLDLSQEFDVSEAHAVLLRALRADATNSDAQFLLADICYRTGRLSQAKNRLADVHRMSEPTAQTTWLGLRLERKLGDREEEMRYVNQLRRKFQESREYQLLMQGNYE